MESERDQVVEPTSQSCHAIGELVGECALASVQRVGGCLRERAIEPPPALGLQASTKRDPSPSARWRGLAQSSIPLVGEEGTAISRAGMRPAR